MSAQIEQTCKPVILRMLNERLGGEQTELATKVHDLIASHPNYQSSEKEASSLKQEIGRLLRPRTHDLRTLMEFPEELVEAATPERQPHRLDLLEI